VSGGRSQVMSRGQEFRLRVRGKKGLSSNPHDEKSTRN